MNPKPWKPQSPKPQTLDLGGLKTPSAPLLNYRDFFFWGGVTLKDPNYTLR